MATVIPLEYSKLIVLSEVGIIALKASFDAALTEVLTHLRRQAGRTDMRP